MCIYGRVRENYHQIMGMEKDYDKKIIQAYELAAN